VARDPASRQCGGNFLKVEQRFEKPTIASQSWVFVLGPMISAGGGFGKEKMKMNKMKKTNKRVITNFGPETRFEVGPVATAPRGEVESDLEQLKARLLKPLLHQAEAPEQSVPLERAANEAAGLAWFTPFPLLFFPALLEEKVYAAQRQEVRQRKIRQQTRGLLKKAAV
jgi:hypothetical protein